VDRRSADGRTWWFQATFQAGALDPATTTALTLPVIVTRLED
jgi:hypothetical protein